MGTIYFILKDDMIYYPPVLSIINVCLDLGYAVTYIGNYSDEIGKNSLKSRGVVFLSTIKLNDNASILKKLVDKMKFRRQVYRYLTGANITNNDYVWVFHTETLCLLNKLTSLYRVVFHPLEFTEYKANWKYKLLSPFINLPKVIRRSAKVVCCEYNRAQITKGILGLNKLPYVLPNKMYLSNDDWMYNVPDDILQIVEQIKNKVTGKKVVLYQGVFLDRERRLEEFCEAIKTISGDYVLIAMGKGSEYYENLKSKYESKNILFIPFIRPPFHLLITQMASIGVLSYFPDSSSISTVINPLYCAPNKIFEYSRYGIPMISNDIPGLFYIFSQFGCGEVVRDPMNTYMIIEAIERIFAQYSSYSKNSVRYYDSIDIKSIIANILSDKN